MHHFGIISRAKNRENAFGRRTLLSAIDILGRRKFLSDIHQFLMDLLIPSVSHAFEGIRFAEKQPFKFMHLDIGQNKPFVIF